MTISIFDLWPTDLNINRDHLLDNDYLPTKFQACGTKHTCMSWFKQYLLETKTYVKFTSNTYRIWQQDMILC